MIVLEFGSVALGYGETRTARLLVPELHQLTGVTVALLLLAAAAVGGLPRSWGRVVDRRGVHRSCLFVT